MGGSSEGGRINVNTGNTGAGRQSIYEEMGGSSEGGRINVNTGNVGAGRQSIYREIGGNEGSKINVNTGNTGQTIGQAVSGYTKGRVRQVKEKVKNNDMYNQTKKSYGLGKNTGRAIRNKIDNKLGR